METVMYACAHRWTIANTQPVLGSGTVESVDRSGVKRLHRTTEDTGRFRVLAVCVECHRYKSFEATPLEENE
jgi:hypothetical protein